MANKQSFLNKARKDKFRLVLSPPTALLEYAKEYGINDLQMSVYGSPVPPISIPSETLMYKGQSLKVTTQTREPYESISVQFTIDNDFKNYWFLWKWLDILNKEKDSGMDEHFSSYSEYDREDIIQTSEKDTVNRVKSTEILNKNNNQSVYHDYMVDITIYGLDEYNNSKIKFTYMNAFITDLAEIDYNFRDTDECESKFTFDFSQFHVELMNEC